MSVNHTGTHKCVGMNFVYLRKDKAIEFDMKVHLEEAIADFLEDIGTAVTTPATIHLFNMDEEAKDMTENHKLIFHSIVAKLPFVKKRVILDIFVAITFLTTRINKSTSDD